MQQCSHLQQCNNATATIQQCSHQFFVSSSSSSSSPSSTCNNALQCSHHHRHHYHHNPHHHCHSHQIKLIKLIFIKIIIFKKIIVISFGKEICICEASPTRWPDVIQHYPEYPYRPCGPCSPTILEKLQHNFQRRRKPTAIFIFVSNVTINGSETAFSIAWV